MQNSQVDNDKAFMRGPQSPLRHKEQFWGSLQDLDTVVSGCRQSSLTLRRHCAISEQPENKSSQFSSSFLHNSNTMKTVRINNSPFVAKYKKSD